MTSVLRLRGRTTPWSFKNKPQALHSGWPSGFRLHSGVVWVKQLVHVVGPLLSFWLPPPPPDPCKFVLEFCFDMEGDDGRLGATEEKPDTGPGPSLGELGND
jgi:hypothetical protein